MSATIETPSEFQAPPEVVRTGRAPLRPTIAERFEAYHAARPDVYALLVKLAFDVKERGQTCYSMKAIFERARWHFHIEKGDDGFVLNNDFTSHYARLIAQNEPELREFFKMRRLRAQ